jgi:hypothetical protein
MEATITRLLQLSRPELLTEARARNLPDVGHGSTKGELLNKVILHALAHPPATADYTELRRTVSRALELASDAAGTALDESRRLSREASAERDAVTEAMRGAEAATPALLNALGERMGKARRLEENAENLQNVHSFGLDVHEATNLLGLWDIPCGNCTTKCVKGVVCTECDAFACASCLSDGIVAANAETSTMQCFNCGDALPSASLAVVLARSHPDQLRKLGEGGARAEALAEHVEYVKKTKRMRTASLSEQLQSVFTEPLACALCQTPAVLGADCMHMKCERCSEGMCGWCMEAEADCEALTCALNPYSGEENDSVDKNKSMLVLRCYRAALLLNGVAPQERTAALVAAAPAMAAAGDPAVGSVSPDDPWLFREAPVAEEDKPYLTSVLRNVLHDAYRGLFGTDAPPFLFRSVECGDVIALIDVALALDDMAVDVDGMAEGATVGATYAGRRGIVSHASPETFCLRFSDGASITLEWEAAARLTRLAEVVAPVARAGANYQMHTGDLVFISSQSHALCLADNAVGWHPAMARMLGTWARVELKRANNAFAVRTWAESYTFTAACAEHVVREADVLAALAASV